MNSIRKHIPIVLLTLWVALCFFWQPPWVKAPVTDGEESFHKVLILSSATEKPRSYMYEASLLDYTDAHPSASRLTLFFPKDSVGRLQQGDVVVLKTQLKEGRGYVPRGQFSRVENRSLREVSVLQGKLRMLSLLCRDRLEERLGRYISSAPERALIESLVLADRRSLDRDQREAFSDAGAMHVLAVSGLHVAFVCQIAMFLLSLGGLLFIPWEKRWLRVAQRLGVLAVVWAYAFLTGMTISVVRSAIMLSLISVNGQSVMDNTNFNRLAFAAFLILFVNPEAMYEPSFLLSFSAVLAMFYFLPFWQERLRTYLPLHRAPKPIRPIAKYGMGLVTSSLAAQIGVLPWTLLFFGQSANYFILTNLIVLPLAPIILVLCFLALACSFVAFLTPVTSFLMQLLNGAAWLMNTGVHWVQSLPGATSFFTFNLTMALLLIALIITSSAHVRTKEKRRYGYLLLAVCLVVALLVVYAQALN